MKGHYALHTKITTTILVFSNMYIFLSINLFVNSLLGTLILTGPNCKTISLLNLYPV